MTQRIVLLFIVPNCVFAVLSLVPSAALIPYVSAVLFATSVGVTISYSPGVIETFLSPKPVSEMDAAEWLGYGILVGWLALAMAGSFSVAWRILGEPKWLTDSHFVAYFRFLSNFGAIAHMLAPGAVNNRIPSARWVRVGGFVALALAAALLGGLIFDRWAGTSPFIRTAF